MCTIREKLAEEILVVLLPLPPPTMHLWFVVGAGCCLAKVHISAAPSSDTIRCMMEAAVVEGSQLTKRPAGECYAMFVMCA